MNKYTFIPFLLSVLLLVISPSVSFAEEGAKKYPTYRPGTKMAVINPQKGMKTRAASSTSASGSTGGGQSAAVLLPIASQRVSPAFSNRASSSHSVQPYSPASTGSGNASGSFGIYTSNRRKGGLSSSMGGGGAAGAGDLSGGRMSNGLYEVGATSTSAPSLSGPLKSTGLPGQAGDPLPDEEDPTPLGDVPAGLLIVLAAVFAIRMQRKRKQQSIENK